MNNHKSKLAFCYAFPTVGTVTKGIVTVKDADFTVFLPEFGLEALIVNYFSVNANIAEKLSKELSGKTINVQVIRTDKLKGYVDVRHIT
ncbi:IF2a-like protein PKR inhibitor [Tanapox virus]|uniref:IF2a-like protein PKR inhibitor n=1 Tax=Tanapox virus TaxID=99000 RepID=Q9QQT3_9POXV|nr:ORFL2R [Tanapox virus]ABQ43484.1 IF2a-like protein PKR inhibitor [Tanapox virus]ABQ43639.1 IF2a-like protein PKR inhibitor [Tanapox virus]